MSSTLGQTVENLKSGTHANLSSSCDVGTIIHTGQGSMLRYLKNNFAEKMFRKNVHLNSKHCHFVPNNANFSQKIFIKLDKSSEYSGLKLRLTHQFLRVCIESLFGSFLF
jgi:hypothetical protein